MTLDIQNADALTVREYNNMRIEMMNALGNLLQVKTVEQLRNEAVMKRLLHVEMVDLEGQWSNEKIKVGVDYAYMPLSEYTVEISKKQV